MLNIAKVIVILCCFNAAMADTITIITPQDNSIYKESYIAVVVKVKVDDADKLVFSNNSAQSIQKEIRSQRDTYCTTLQISPASNSIKITAFKGEKIVEEQQVYIYRESNLSKLKASDQYSKKFFHNPTNEATCSRCHDMSVNGEEDVAFEEISDSNCFTCHKTLIYKKFAHAPTANFVCLACHTGNTKSRFALQDPIGKQCLKCHKKSKKLFQSDKFQHKPIRDGLCSICHNPHSSDINKNFLRKQAWDLCISCHKDKKRDRNHITTTFSRKLHPTKGVKDPSSKDGLELSCISCHNPHSSNNSYMLIDYNIEQSSSIWCKRCHKQK